MKKPRKRRRRTPPACPTCEGSGSIGDLCKRCGFGHAGRDCSACQNTGIVNERECPKCGGTGDARTAEE